VLVRREFEAGIMMARSSVMAFTRTETRRMLDPIGIDRSPYRPDLNCGIRDILPITGGGR
jgi:hypothetical protein